jgi:DNA-binding PadR family transcriptional regulator
MALSHAILVAIAHAPCSGYDLSKRFAGSVGFFWHASQQQVYRELTKLEEQGYLTAEVIRQVGRPDKRLLEITQAGRDFVRSWIAEPSEISPIKDELLVKLYGGTLVDAPVLLRELRDHQRQHQAMLRIYQDIEASFFGQPVAEMCYSDRCIYLTLRNGITYEQAWLTWCEEAIGLLSSEDGF